MTRRRKASLTCHDAFPVREPEEHRSDAETQFDAALAKLVAKFRVRCKAYPHGASHEAKRRDAFLLALTVLCTLAASHVLGARAAAIAAMLLFVSADLHSGLAHVVLDDERAYAFAPLSAPVLEFQAHHAVPRDLVVLPASRVAAAAIWDGAPPQLLVALAAYACAPRLASSLLLTLSWKLFFTGYGQLSHRASHMARSEVPPPLRALQRVGLMISSERHNEHHRAYDTQFCTVSGWAAPAVDWLFRRVTGVKGRMALAALGFLDVPLVAMLVGG